jgi:hypothetical protein
MGELIDLGVKAGIVSRSPVPGSPTTASGSARVVKTPSSSCATNPILQTKSRMPIRQNAGLIA